MKSRLGALNEWYNREMKRTLLIISVILFAVCLVRPAYALEDPLSKPNNFMGIHILYPSELDQAKGLINSSGGDWGYVTIPIQIGDRNIETWQAFMDKSKELHVIPIIRLATQPDPNNTSVWLKPTEADIIDFANFLSSLHWPTTNKYVILFNEINRFDEWGGEYPDPQRYAEIVDFANSEFKKRDANFYLILGGMDAAAPNDRTKYINGFTYLEELANSTDIENKIDAFSSHSYPNPAFSAPPSEKRLGVATYRYEYDILNRDAKKKLPVFITETGWSDKTLSPLTISGYYDTTFEDIWNKDKDKIVAITPFLLNSTGGPFDNFSFFVNGKEKDFYKTLITLSKDKGTPTETKKLALNVIKPLTLIPESFDTKKQPDTYQEEAMNPFVKLYFKTILGIR